MIFAGAAPPQSICAEVSAIYACQRSDYSLFIAVRARKNAIIAQKSVAERSRIAHQTPVSTFWDGNGDLSGAHLRSGAVSSETGICAACPPSNPACKARGRPSLIVERFACDLYATLHGSGSSAQSVCDLCQAGCAEERRDHRARARRRRRLHRDGKLTRRFGSGGTLQRHVGRGAAT